MALCTIITKLKLIWRLFFDWKPRVFAWAGPGEWEEWWDSQGVVVLHNNITAVPSLTKGGPYSSNCNATFDLVGVPDLGHNPKLKDFIRIRVAKILIAHQPLEVIQAAKEKLTCNYLVTPTLVTCFHYKLPFRSPIGIHTVWTN